VISTTTYKSYYAAHDFKCPVLVVFTAPRQCQPCIEFDSVLRAYSEGEGALDVLLVDIEGSGVKKAVPTIEHFNAEGGLVASHLGKLDLAELKTFVETGKSSKGISLPAGKGRAFPPAGKPRMPDVTSFVTAAIGSARDAKLSPGDLHALVDRLWTENVDPKA
jgi:hypothetical protein